MKRFILLLLVGTLVTCKQRPLPYAVKAPVIADSGMVVSAHPLASEVGVRILRNGGNAVDAAIATQFALAVVHPAAGNLGGGGFMVYREHAGSVATLDYRESAPAAAFTEMFLSADAEVVAGLSEDSQLASGCPGSVAGMWEAHQKFGTLPWRDLVTPAIELALNGFPLTEKEASGLNSIQSALKANNTIQPLHLLRDHWKSGDTLILEDLGHTLERIRDNGRDGFYKGTTAELIVAEMQRGNGLISREDLENYRSVWRDPVTAFYKDFKIISMAPPSSGGVALIQLLKSIEPFPVKSWGHNDVRTVHLFTEAERRVYADRAVHLGDPDFYEVPAGKLMNVSYIKERMSSFDPSRATPSTSVAAGAIPGHESDQTTHLSVVDAMGNAVAVTTTLNDSYGNKIVVGGAGFLLNNEMDDFSLKPGHPNMYGAIGGEANKILPRKRMLSSMTPTIVERNGKLFMVVGTPGGTTIITSVFQTIVNVVEHGMTMQEAVSARRIHSQWLPDEVVAEEYALSDESIAALERLGHRIVRRGNFGRVDAILVREDGRLEGGADPRGDDTATGY